MKEKRKELMAFFLCVALIAVLTACAGKDGRAAYSEPSLSEEDKADENPEAVDVDATTSASVLPPGNTAMMANWIRERAGGDLFSIVVEEPYWEDYDECLDRAADEKADNARPGLVYHVENMQEYNVIFLGYPYME